MDFRALPPQCRQGIGRIHAGPDIIYEGEILDLLVPMIAEPEGGPSSDMQRYEG